MMNCYKLIFETDTYHSLLMEASVPYKKLNDYDGRSLAAGWRPLKVNLYKTTKVGNVFRLTGHLPVFDARAVEATQHAIGDYVEFLPIVHDEPELGELYLVNVTAVLDCLDRDKSAITYFDDGSILSVSTYAFDAKTVGATPLFRIKGLELKNIFASDSFKNLFEASGLTGLSFKK